MQVKVELIDTNVFITVSQFSDRQLFDVLTYLQNKTLLLRTDIQQIHDPLPNVFKFQIFVISNEDEDEKTFNDPSKLLFLLCKKALSELRDSYNPPQSPETAANDDIKIDSANSPGSTGFLSLSPHSSMTATSTDSGQDAHDHDEPEWPFKRPCC